jgi:ATP adenylyltransferase
LSLVDRVAASAIQSGALHSIPTSVRRVSDREWEFDIRIVEQLARKMSATANSANHGPPRNPFLPYDEQLFVADIPPRHVCLLNKFNVVQRHLLLITREFRPQTSLLDWEDFTALANLMAEGEGVAFYNGGPAAGASQPHKHLQWAPVLPSELPFAPFFNRRLADSTYELFPFRHYFTALPKREFRAFETLGRQWWEAYRRGLEACGLVPTGSGEERLPGAPPAIGELLRELPRELPPYNLVMTREWLLCVPRSRETVAGISLNSLAFVGALMARDVEQYECLREFGPWRALLAVTCPASPAGDG